MGAAIFTFIWLVSIMHNVDKSWALHSVDHGFLIELDAACATNGGDASSFVWDSNTDNGDMFNQATHAGISINNTDCVVDAVQNWMADYNRTRGYIFGVNSQEGNSGSWEKGSLATYDRDGVKGDHDNFYTLTGLHAYENGANTSVITALVFTTLAMLLGVLNFIMLLVSWSRSKMFESMFSFCAGFGGLIIVASPWISDVVLNSAGDEFVALPVMVAFQLTLLWVRPGDVDGVETKEGGFIGL